MHCAICDNNIFSLKPARHLPRFARCPNCTGYVTAEKEAASYPAEYFSQYQPSVGTGGAEEPQKQRRSIFSPLLDFFLWLRMRKIARSLDGKKGEIFDYGCGNGKLVAYLRDRGFEAEGYDPEPSAVTLAQKQGLPVFGVVPNKKYDLVMFWHSLEHSDTPLRDVTAITSHLQPTGRLLIAVPNGDSFEARFAGESWFCYDWPFHRVHFTPKALTILLEKAGFRVLFIDYVNPEYTVSSLVQTFLNLFLPKNALYSMVSHRRMNQGTIVLIFVMIFSAALLAAVSPFLVLVFLLESFFKRTAAFIAVAEQL